MKSSKTLLRGLAILGIVGAGLLAGCGGGGGSNPPPPPPPPNPTPAVSTISPRTALAGGTPFKLTIDGSNFVAGSIVYLDGDAASSTTFISSTQLTANISADNLDRTPRSATVTVTNPAPGGGTSNAVTFTLTAGYTSVAVDPTGKFAYATNGTSNAVSIYMINETTGTLTSLGLIAAGTSPASVAVDRFGKFAYVANEDSNDVSAYTIDSTTGTLVSVDTVAAGTSPKAVAVDPSGKFAYVANWDTVGNVSMYTIDASTGALTPTGTVAAGRYPESITIDPSGKLVFVVNGYPDTVSTYTVNTTTGALTPTGTLAVAASSSTLTTIAIAPSGKFAYMVADGCAFDIVPGGKVFTYSINPTTRALTSTGSSVAVAGFCPNSMTVDPMGQFAYVTAYWGDNVSMYTIDGTTGVLTPTGTVATGHFPTSIAVHPSGKFAYVTNSGSNNISMYNIDAATGALTLIGTMGT